jgi:hypothetical protein
VRGGELGEAVLAAAGDDQVVAVGGEALGEGRPMPEVAPVTRASWFMGSVPS